MDVQQKVERVMRRSVQYAFQNPEASAEFVAQHAQEMDVAVRQKHIDLYVNHFTEGLGTVGRAAVTTLFEMAKQRGVLPFYTSEIFLN